MNRAPLRFRSFLQVSLPSPRAMAVQLNAFQPSWSHSSRYARSRWQRGMKLPTFSKHSSWINSKSAFACRLGYGSRSSRRRFRATVSVTGPELWIGTAEKDCGLVQCFGAAVRAFDWSTSCALHSVRLSKRASMIVILKGKDARPALQIALHE